jgi:hypothetical protein
VPGPLHKPQSGDREQLALGLHNVTVARDRLGEARRAGVRRWEEQTLRADLLAALESYAAAITATGAPLSYRMRAEIDLYRQLGGA